MWSPTLPGHTQLWMTCGFHTLNAFQRKQAELANGIPRMDHRLGKREWRGTGVQLLGRRMDSVLLGYLHKQTLGYWDEAGGIPAISGNLVHRTVKDPPSSGASDGVRSPHRKAQGMLIGCV